MKIQKIQVDEGNISSASIGGGVLPAGQGLVTIKTSAVNTNSRIFITPTSDTDKPLVVKNQIQGASFDVTITSPYTSDIKFNWWIVN